MFKSILVGASLMMLTGLSYAEEPVKYETTIILKYKDIDGKRMLSKLTDILYNHEDACDVDIYIDRVDKIDLGIFDGTTQDSILTPDDNVIIDPNAMLRTY